MSSYSYSTNADPADAFAAVEDPAVAQMNGDRPTGVFAQVQAHWADHATQWQYDIEVAGSGGLLVLRMGPIDGRDLAELGARASANDSVAAMAANSDLLIRGCTAVLGRERPRGEPEPQIGPSGQPYRLDADLADALNMPASATARQVLLKVYSGVPSPELAIGEAASKYIEWARGADDEIGELVVGESGAGG